MDYSSLSVAFDFSPGNRQQCVEIDAKEDGYTEGQEIFTVSLSSSHNVNLSLDKVIIFVVDANCKWKNSKYNIF